ncbi:hypothetical protein CCP3SC15_140034 [Gammaproteobacteria bacterium]
MGDIIEINGPLVRVRLPGVLNGEQVKIGKLGLVGEVIGRDAELAMVQVYESTEGVRPGESAVALGHPLAVELGPGLLGQIYDGVQRPLTRIQALSGDHIARGLEVPSLDRERSWAFTPNADLVPGSDVKGGMVLGTVPETRTITHRVLLPPDIEGKLLEIAPAGEYPVEHVIARVSGKDGDEHTVCLYHRWPVRIPRPYAKRDHAVAPLITGQRILDTFFPLVKGGKGAVPGPFGAGKTWSSSRSRAGPTPTSSSTSAAASGQRAGGYPGDLPGTQGPPHWALADGTHPAGGQHLQHAGGGA